jgi:hypothetical protein
MIFHMSEDCLPVSPAWGAHPDEDGDPAAPDARVARAEERLAFLRELAELGMALTRDLVGRTLEAPDAPEPATAAAADADAPKPAPRAIPGPRHDPADSFARLSRAVRLSLALEAKAEEELADILAGGKDRAAAGAKTATAAPANDEDFVFRVVPRDYPSAHRNRIRDNVFEAINREITEVIPAHEALDALYERLFEGERYDAFVHRPLKEAVQGICEDLGLSPDWSRWTDEGFPPRAEGERGYLWQMVWAPDWDQYEAIQERRRGTSAGAGPPAPGGPRLE